MLWPREQFIVAYKQVLSDAIDTYGASVLLLVALDVDSIAAVSILTSLLQADMVAYSLVPVSGYKQLAEMTFSSEIRSIFLINCGAMVDVYSSLKLTDQKVYVIDSHRPLHLANVYDRHGIVVLFDDEGQAEGDFPEDGSDIEAIEQEDEGDEEEDDDDEDSDDESEGEAEVPDQDLTEPGVGAKRKRTDSDASDGTEDGVDETQEQPVDETAETIGETDGAIETTDAENETAKADDNAADADDESNSEEEEEKSEAEEVPQNDVAEKTSGMSSKRKRRLEILQYYRGSFYGAPAATLTYELASQLNQSSQDKVWYAIVGLTKQFIAQQIDADNYNMLVQKFQDEVLALPGTANEEVKDVDGTVLPSVLDGSIAFEEEYRFVLYRHWSLYQSMYYSNYVAAKLKCWQAAGKDELEVFLARMGLSLKECHQSFTFMARDLKQDLRDKFRELAPEFGLDDMFYGSFRRHFEFKHQWCAADIVYGLSALLEAPAYVTKKALAPHVPDAVDNLDDDEAPFWPHSFHLAMEALPCKSSRSCLILERGMHIAMELQQAIVHLGISILDRKLIVRVKHFRYVCLRLTEEEELLFSHASTLSKLALFLVDVHREQGKWIGKHAAPFVLISHLKARNVYLVVGVTCPERAGEIHRK
ncbi:hypothetical protein LEN26_007815 [Aphanomyces euteiches]|nr:hypothetical protein AeMF1_003789 [Aphanomyces euteiches]KAH9131223.1 hypothetical protein LEN26_007815 [Aphanomyces euteiches]